MRFYIYYICVTKLSLHSGLERYKEAFALSTYYRGDFLLTRALARRMELAFRTVSIVATKSYCTASFQVHFCQIE